MQLRYQYRLNPTPGQQAALARTFGCARVVFNDAVAAREQARRDGQPYPRDAELSHALTAAKATPERVWLGEVSSVVLQQALADANTAYRNFFASLSGRRKGRKIGPPRFRSRRDNRQSIRFTRNARFQVTAGGKLRLPKIGDVPVRWSRDLPSAPSSVTVVKDTAGRYFASFVVEVGTEPLPEVDSEVPDRATQIRSRQLTPESNRCDTACPAPKQSKTVQPRKPRDRSPSWTVQEKSNPRCRHGEPDGSSSRSPPIVRIRRQCSTGRSNFRSRRADPGAAEVQVRRTAGFRWWHRAGPGYADSRRGR